MWFRKLLHIFVMVISIFVCSSFGQESFIVKPKNKPEPKVALEDCMSNILDEQKLLTRIESYGCAIKAYELNWVDQVFNEQKNAFLKKASNEQLQKLTHEQQQFKVECQKFEQAAHRYRDFIVHFEQELTSVKSSK